MVCIIELCAHNLRLCSAEVLVVCACNEVIGGNCGGGVQMTRHSDFRGETHVHCEMLIVQCMCIVSAGCTAHVHCECWLCSACAFVLLKCRGDV